MSEKRALQFNSEDDALAEIAKLRKGYRQLKNWNLPMVGRHASLVIQRGLQPPASPIPTPEEAERKKAFVDVVLTTGRPPAGFTPPPDIMPPADCDDTDISKMETALQALKTYPHPLVAMVAFGPVSIGEFRRLNLIHLAHHLGFLIPK